MAQSLSMATMALKAPGAKALLQDLGCFLAELSTPDMVDLTGQRGWQCWSESHSDGDSAACGEGRMEPLCTHSEDTAGSKLALLRAAAGLRGGPGVWGRLNPLCTARGKQVICRTLAQDRRGKAGW